MTDLAPALPDDYDAAKEAGWVYHRNGIGGRPFCAIVSDGALHLRLVEDDPNDPDETVYGLTDAARIVVRLAVLAPLAAIAATSHTVTVWGETYRRVVEFADGPLTFTVFDAETYGQRVVLITGPDDIECAVTLDQVLAGGTVDERWRGDALAEATAGWRT